MKPSCCAMFVFKEFFSENYHLISFASFILSSRQNTTQNTFKKYKKFMKSKQLNGPKPA